VVRFQRGFAGALAAIAAAGFGLRLLYVLAYSKGLPVTGDALTYHLVAGRLAAGDGFVRPVHAGLPAPLGIGPTAEHPPLFELLLAALDRVGVDSVLGQKAAMCVVGTATVVLVGLAARDLAGKRAGLIAAALAAAYPLLWVAEGSLMSESLYGALMAGLLLAAIRFARAPGPRGAALLGALAGLATLTRGEALLLAPILLLPLALTRALPVGRRAGLAAASLVAMALVLAPWTIRNAIRFDRPVIVSTNSSALLAGANCRSSYHGRFLGLWQFRCYGRRPPGDESRKAAVYRRRGLDYARDHAGRLPLVLAARMGRVWDLYRPGQQVNYEYFEGRSKTASRLGLIAYYPLLVLAIAGALLLRRGRRPLLPVLALPALVSVTALLTYGLTRFRFAAEPALVVLAAVALDAAVAAALLRRRTSSGAATSSISGSSGAR
jgi:Dolichyl-phosphate-mannose-protein mannosyltransferase